MRSRLLALLVLSALTSVLCLAQDGTQPSRIAPPATSSGFTVTGRVLCADTQRPARFAQVMLLPASANTSDYDRGRMAVGRTDLDGRFSMDNVPAGDYFATAELTGYVDDAPAVRAAISQGGDALNTISAVPRVEVSTGGGSVQITLQHGAVVSGTVQWDDGSPASGVQITVQAAATTGTLSNGVGARNGPPFFGFGNQTDDRGHYRLSGLAPGSYVVRASMQSPLPGSVGGAGRFTRTLNLSVYAPNKLRKTEAAVVTLAAGEERSDANITLGLAGMHTVSGEVSSSAASVHSGYVQLTDQVDSSLNRRVDIAADGSFIVPYVPPGTYTLVVNASSRQPSYGRGGSPTDGIRFQPMQESLTVADSDLSGVSVNVNMATASQ